ncbi:MAG: Transcriptional regulator of ribosomal biogenesis proteins [Candelina mexicana]|nr:MAG: Transcriptional regulator of ribosomal biogenesis proteins [Candelina mexicana]
MTGTSPFTTQSPSYHSSSYLPKLEANFMRDFSCCGKTLPSLHDLLQHYEVCHTDQQVPQSFHSSAEVGRDSQALAVPNGGATRSTGNATVVSQSQEQLQKLPQQLPPKSRQPPSPRPNNMHLGPQGSASGIQMLRQQQPEQTSTNLPIPQTTPDMDSVEDMEMDDAIEGSSSVPPPPAQHGFQMRQQPQQAQFALPTTPRAQPLNLNTANIPSALQAHQGLRTSQPTTPTALGHNGRPYQHNPTFSSVNTPTLTPHPLQHQQPHLQTNRTSPDSSSPGTPDELDNDFIGNLAGEMSMPNGTQYLQGVNQGYGYQFGDVPDMLNLCIDDPAKRLSSPGGFGNQQQFGFGGTQFGRSQQMMPSISGIPGGIMPMDDPKPYKCPVIGCEKAYKNQNGLKYHRGHGHNTQQLQENANGTYSIVNPETSIPYPGTMGMEKEKPYFCEACKKRYKNLNGLKYHKQHSPQCSTDTKPIGVMASMGMQNTNVNVAGAGLPGIGEDSIF